MSITSTHIVRNWKPEDYKGLTEGYMVAIEKFEESLIDTDLAMYEAPFKREGYNWEEYQTAYNDAAGRLKSTVRLVKEFDESMKFFFMNDDNVPYRELTLRSKLWTIINALSKIEYRVEEARHHYMIMVAKHNEQLMLEEHPLLAR